MTQLVHVSFVVCKYFSLLRVCTIILKGNIINSRYIILGYGEITAYIEVYYPCRAFNIEYP